MPDRPTVSVLPNPAALADAVADHVVDVVARALDRRGVAHVALAGGSTPRAINALLSAPPRRERVRWNEVVFWFGDERCVAPDDDESNYKMNRETLLDPLGIAPERVHRMRGEDDPGAAAADYDVIMRRELGDAPHLDLVLLGMGPEGHTASLFPGTVAAIDKHALAIAHYVPQLDRWRLTMTPHAINSARHVAFAIAGAAKADALHAVLEGPREPDVYPAQAVHPAGDLRWFVDAEAAARL